MNDMELVDFVLEFTQQMNELEMKYSILMQKSDHDAPAIFANFEVEAREIYQKYLTSKERSYYFGIGSPPKFSAVNNITLSTVESTKNRATVTIYTRKGLIDFQFNLLRKNNQWLINSFKQRYHSDDRELVYKWQYGCF